MIEITIDISVIKLHAGKNDVVRPVVQKLGSLIEEGAVVLVSFQNNILSASRIPSAIEVERYAPDKETGIQARSCKHPCSKRRSRGFTMGPGDHQGSPRLNEKQAQSLWKRNIRNRQTQHGVGFGIVPRYRIADDDKIRPRLNV